ncbi:MAG: hypothetical protein ACFB9N_03465 [Geitlerinemataceae cyanobacterium]
MTDFNQKLHQAFSLLRGNPLTKQSARQSVDICNEALSILPGHPAFLWVLSDAVKVFGDYGRSELLKRQAMAIDAQIPQKLGISYDYLPHGYATPNLMQCPGWNADSVADSTVTDDTLDRLHQLHCEPNILGFDRPNETRELFAMSPKMYGQFALLAFGYVFSRCLLTLEKDTISFLDWGGGAGQYYQHIRELFPDLDIDYHCKDVPKLVARGAALNASASFYEDDDICFQRDYDFILISGALQYVKDWKEPLRKAVSSGCKNIFITRLTATDTGSFWMRQYAYDSFWMTEIININELISLMKDLGYELKREFVLESCIYMVGAPAWWVSGLWFQAAPETVSLFNEALSELF